MTFSLENAVVYDEETFPNVFTLAMECLHNSTSAVWEISQYRDDRRQLIEWCNWVHHSQIPMIGFFSLLFDYPVLHYIYKNPQATYQQIYAKSQEVIKADNFSKMIWESDRFAPQIDLFKIHHFDNKAKQTSLKALQINMRAETVVDMPVPIGTYLTEQQINELLIPYNKHDVKRTKDFAHISMDSINFRAGLIPEFGIDVLNYSDVKIGAKIFEQRLGDDICYDRSSGRKQPRQTIRRTIPLRDIIFPYVRFQNPEFARVHEWMKQQTLTPDDLDDPDALIKTKGVFKKVTANVGDIEFHFGTGGMHACVKPQRIYATGKKRIRDIDVKALYPSIALANSLSPAHLKGAFEKAYREILAERAKYAKGTVQNAGYKLAANGPWGQSNNPFTIFFDSQYAMTIPINGQLLICMLAEWMLAAVPTFQLIQVNTDGITYYIDDEHEPAAAAIQKQWEQFTLLELENTDYAKMFIRDVNNYIAIDLKGKTKLKGAYWTPDAGAGYNDSISKSSPPAWHKDLGGIVQIKAAVAAMTRDINPEHFIRTHTDPFDFMLRVKVDKSSKLMLGDKQIQGTTRYYVARNGASMRKISPPKGELGEYKRKNGISDQYYNQVRKQLEQMHQAQQWDERIHTKNKSKYEMVETAIEAGWKIAECNDCRNFRFDNINFEWYVTEARKLII